MSTKSWRIGQGLHGFGKVHLQLPGRLTAKSIATINNLKISFVKPDGTALPDVLINQGAGTTTVTVPTGRNYAIRVQGFTGPTLESETYGYLDSIDHGQSKTVPINTTTTPTGKVLYKLASNGGALGQAQADAINVVALAEAIGTQLTGKTPDTNAIANAVKGASVGSIPALNSLYVPQPTLAWWKGEENVTDSASSHNGTWQGEAAYLPGRVGKAFSITSGNEIAFDNTIGNWSSSNYTFAFWLQTSMAQQTVLFSKRSICSNTNQWSINMASGKISLEQDQSGDWGTGGIVNHIALESVHPVNDGQFHHVAFVRQGTNISIFIDGVLDASGATSGVTIVNNNLPLTMGTGVCTQYLTHFVGAIDEIKAFNLALQPSEILALTDY